MVASVIIPRLLGRSGFGHCGAVGDGPIYDLSVGFEARGVRGTVDVSVWVNSDPASVGSGPEAEGFPACQAAVSIELRGYDALLGWVQLVGTKSPIHPACSFEVDPLQVFADLNLPFGFFGMLPTLFDAPSRRDRNQTLDWLAQTFLCMSPADPMDRVVRPVVAFHWGFRMHAGQIDTVAPAALPAVHMERPPRPAEAHVRWLALRRGATRRRPTKLGRAMSGTAGV
jgi:hypothetical protein